MEELLTHLRSLNYHLPDFTPDGVLRRFDRDGKKLNGWYIAWQNARTKDGTFYYVISFGDWRTGEKHLYTPAKLSRADKKVVDEQIKASQLKIKKDQEKKQLECADLAEKRFAGTGKTGTTPYMDRKLMPELYGCGLYLDRVQVPMRDVDGKLWSLQTIFPDGQKRFMAGGRKRGCFHVIGSPIGDAPIYLCEGLATGASIHQATRATVVVAFDAGNLVEVAKELSTAYPHTEIRIAGDDDRANEENPGRAKAQKAALISSGITLFPQFEGSEGTDFNDVHVAYGLGTLRTQLIGEAAERKTGFIPLGHQDGNYFFYELAGKDIVRANTFSPVQLWSLASKDYWEANYPTAKGGIDFNEASNDLIRTARAIGPFDSSRIRGTGVWLDRARVVINTGHSLLVDGQEMSLSAIDSRYIYIQTANRMPPIHDKALSAVEGGDVAKTCSAFKWRNNTDGYLLAGWLFLARVGGALPIRPHIWITGGKGTGKSTLMEGLIAPALGSPKGKMHLLGSTTEAGIRQTLRASSLPIIFDEFESTTPTSRERIEAILELMRNSWSTSQGKILKGSAGGASVEYQLHFAALVSSIRVSLNNDADRSRFSVLELMPHGDDPADWQRLQALLQTMDEEIGERMFARACNMVPNIIATQKMLAPHLARAHSQRYAQQVGTLLAGCWVLQSDTVISAENAKEFIAAFMGDHEAAKLDDQEMTDEEECLNRLLTRKLDLRGKGLSPPTATMSLGEALKDAFWRDYVAAYGVKVVKDQFLVAYHHDELEKHYRGSRWDKNWARSLKRLPNASATNPLSFGARNSHSRCVSLPMSLLN